MKCRCGCGEDAPPRKRFIPEHLGDPNPGGICLCGCGKPTPLATRTVRRQQQVLGKHTPFLKGHMTPERRANRRPRSTGKVDCPLPNPTGLCMCGCGQPAPLAKCGSRRNGWVRGKPVRFIVGHMGRVLTPKGEANPGWKGGRYMREGYVMLRLPEHPAADGKGYVPEHRVVWEQTHGRTLTPDEHVHHINGIRDDNRPENLVALDMRTHALEHGLGTGFTVEERRRNAAHETHEQRVEAGRKAWRTRIAKALGADH